MKHINTTEKCEKFVINDQSFHNRHLLVPYCNTAHIYKYFKEARQNMKQHAFEFPYHFGEAGAKIVQFDDVIEPDQIILDLRSSDHKEWVLQNKEAYTFKLKSDNFQERPQLIE